MEFIIDFFRGIDGWPYYTMLVVNTILIFAIIGYIGEKSNEELARASATKGVSNIKSGTMNLTPVHTSNNAQQESIPNVVTTQRSVQSTPVVPTVPNIDQANNQVNCMVNNAQMPGVNNNVGVVNNEVSSNEKAPAVLIINSDGMNKDVK